MSLIKKLEGKISQCHSIALCKNSALSLRINQLKGKSKRYVVIGSDSVYFFSFKELRSSIEGFPFVNEIFEPFLQEFAKKFGERYIKKPTSRKKGTKN